MSLLTTALGNGGRFGLEARGLGGRRTVNGIRNLENATIKTEFTPSASNDDAFS